MSAYYRRSIKYHLNKILLLAEYLLGVESPQACPIELFLEPTTLCNLACPACPTGQSKQVIREKANLETYKEGFGLYSEYLDKWYLYNWGEPLLHNQIGEILKILATGKFGIYTSSNFSMPIQEDVLSVIGSTVI